MNIEIIIINKATNDRNKKGLEDQGCDRVICKHRTVIITRYLAGSDIDRISVDVRKFFLPNGAMLHKITVNFCLHDICWGLK